VTADQWAEMAPLKKANPAASLLAAIRGNYGQARSPLRLNPLWINSSRVATHRHTPGQRLDYAKGFQPLPKGMTSPFFSSLRTWSTPQGDDLKLIPFLL